MEAVNKVVVMGGARTRVRYKSGEVRAYGIYIGIGKEICRNGTRITRMALKQ